MAKKRKRHWFDMDTPLGVVKIYACRSVVHPDGDICLAVYYPGTNTMDVEWNENVDLMKMNLFHEIIHNCFTGASNVIRTKIFGPDLTEEETDEREEELASFLDAKFYDLLTRNGMLKIPNPPNLDK